MTFPEEDDFKLIDSDDFKSIELLISIKNLATETEIREGKRSYGKQLHSKDESSEIVRLIEFVDGGLVLEVPPRTGAVGHQILVTIRTKGAKEDVEFTGKASIVDVEKSKQGSEEFQLKFVEFDPKSLERLLGVYQSRQNEIFEFFKAAKGL